MYLDNKLVFLAGSTGCAGSSIMNYILDNFPTTRVRAAYYRHTKPFVEHKMVEHVRGDLRSRSACRRMVAGCDCAVLAAASTAGAGIITSQPWRQLNDNLIMNAQMLEACHFENVRRAVVIGSATLYQEFSGHIKENDLDMNQDPYPAHFGIGWVTRFTEKQCQFWHSSYGMEVVLARAANIFGPHARFDPAASNFVPAIIRKAVDKMDPFEVWGTPDVTRDVIYAEDFGHAIVMMLDNNEVKFDVFNIGSGVQTTVADVVAWALKSAGHKPSTIRYNEGKPTTIRFRGLDCTKAREVLGWQPRFTIEEGIQKTTEWWQENRNWWVK